MPGGWTSRCWPRWPGRRPPLTAASRWLTCADRPASWKRSPPAWSSWDIRRFGSGPSGSAPAGGEAGVAMDETALDDGALDGNAIGGLLIEVFGTEMTTAVATCGSCGTAGPVAGLAVYEHGPGTVVRCRLF